MKPKTAVEAGSKSEPIPIDPCVCDPQLHSRNVYSQVQKTVLLHMTTFPIHDHCTGLILYITHSFELLDMAAGSDS